VTLQFVLFKLLNFFESYNSSYCYLLAGPQSVWDTRGGEECSEMGPEF